LPQWLTARIEAYQAMAQQRSTKSHSFPAEAPDAAGPYVIGADIGGTNLRLALADCNGTIQGRWACSTANMRDAAAVVGRMHEGVDALLREASLPPDSLGAIAAGAPGTTNVEEGVVIATSYLMGWRDVPLGSMLEAEFGVPAAVDNDVNLAAIGELHAGEARGANDFVFLAIGTGIGAGIVLNGRVHRGSAWAAGEIGYMLVPGLPEAPVERGQPGALEGIAGGEGIRSQWKQRWRSDLTPLPQEATATEIFDHALKENALAQQVLQLAARTLGYAIYNIALVLNTPLFVFGGGVGVHPALIGAVQRVIEERSEPVQPELARSALGTDAQLTGAVFLALQTAARTRSRAAAG
jgi:glucokinase